ncbi:MAG: DUF6782 family putative metallopeptidase [Geminicoccaceae bacterium]
MCWPLGRSLAFILFVLTLSSLVVSSVRAERPLQDDGPGQALSLSVDERIRALIPQADDRCLIAGSEPALTATQIGIEDVLEQLRLSALGDWLVRQAELRGITLCIDSATDLEAHYRSHLGLIGLNAKLGKAGQVVFLAHELAHVPQHPRFSNNRRFSPEDMIVLHRTREATAEAVATRVLWQLREQGIEEPWQAKLQTAYGDITEIFEKVMGDSHDPSRELWATRSAFRQWFEADWRPEIYDDLMLKTLAKIAVDRIGLLPPSRSLSDEFLGDIAWYAGQSFLIKGDGRALIEHFRETSLSSGNQGRLDRIFARSATVRLDRTSRPSPIEGDGLSASSSGPILRKTVD